MIAPEQIAEIRRLFYAEHWKIGTIAESLGLHAATVRAAVETDRFNRPRLVRASTLTDPYLGFIGQTLEQYPDLRATRIYQMIRARGYVGSVVQLRRVVARLRPGVHREAFLALRTFAGDEAQADWAHFGEVCVGRAKRRLSCFVLTLSYSRALALEFFFDQSLENFLRGHVRAFGELGGVARTILYDNLRSAVLERRGDAIHFHPRLVELCAHYHFQARPCRPARGSEKGRVERVIRYVRESYFAARTFTTLAVFNREARAWRDEIAHRRPWPGDDRRTGGDAFEEEKARLLPLPAHPFDTDLLRSVRSEKTIYVRFDLNDYSIPPTAVGRPLTLAASDTEVRLLDGAREIARHPRSYDRHERIEDPAHQMALLEDKRKATGSTRNSRLAGAVPEIEALLDAAFARGEPAGAQTTQLLLLLDDYGPAELRAAVQEALERGTPRASSVAYILSRRHRLRRGRAALPVNLTRRPDLADVHVEPHNPETYDELTRDDDPDE
jgi:transposase